MKRVDCFKNEDDVKGFDNTDSVVVPHDDVEEFINDVENRVNEALSCLGSIKCLDDLNKIQDCHLHLKSLSEDLY